MNRIERIVAMLTGLGIIILVSYLVIRNEPFSDPNLVIIVRTIMSLAVSILGATIPGFLNLSWNAGGVAIRAGGALALFVLTYWLTPEVAPSLNQQAIRELTEPSIVSVPVAHNSGSDIKVDSIYVGSIEPQSKSYDLILSNTGTNQIFLRNFLFDWNYWEGSSSSIDEGRSIKPVEDYALEMVLEDPGRSLKLTTSKTPIYPPIVLPPANESGPSITSVRLEVLYRFGKGAQRSHFNSDWNFFYKVAVETSETNRVEVLKDSWRGEVSHDAIDDWLSRYREVVNLGR